VIVNIILYHALLEPTGVAPGLLVNLLELFLLFAYRKSFRGLFDAAPEI
jgi:putative oxidoreductase